MTPVTAIPSRLGRLLRGLGRAVYLIVKFAIEFVVVLTLAFANAVYTLLSRTALYLSTVYLLIYFVGNSLAFKSWLMVFLSELMVADLDCAAIEMSPVLFRVTVLDTDLKDGRGTSVITAEKAVAAIDLGAMLSYAVRSSLRDDVPFELRLTENHAIGANVLVEVDRDGWVGIGTMWGKTKPSTEPDDGPPSRVELLGCKVERTRFRLDVNDGELTVDARDLETTAKVVIVGSWVRVTSPGLNASRGRVTIDGVGPKGTPLDLPWHGLKTGRALWVDGRLALERALLTASETRALLVGKIETKGQVSFDATAMLDAPRNDPAVTQWLPDDTRAEARVVARVLGPPSAIVADVSVQSPRVTAAGFELGPMTLALSVAPEEAARAGDGLRVRVAPFSLAALGGALHVDELVAWPTGVDDVRLAARAAVRLDAVDPSEVWNLGLVQGAVPALLDSQVTAAIDADVQWRRTDGGSVFEVASSLDLAATWRGAPGMPLAPHYGLRADSTAVIGPKTTVEADLSAWSGSERVTLRGALDAEADTVDVAGDLRLELAPFLAALGVAPSPDRTPWVSGALRLAKLSVRGPLAAPDVTANLTVTDARVLGNRVDGLKAKVALHDGTLTVTGLRGATELGSVKAAATLHLFDGDFAHLDSRLPLTVTNAEVTGVELGRFKSLGITGTARVTAPEVRLELGTPGLALHARADVRVDDVEAYGERASRVTASVRLDGQKVDVKPIDVQLEGGATIAASLRLDRSRLDRLTAHARISDLDLSDVRALAKKNLPISTRIDAVIDVSGPMRDLDIESSITLEKLVAYGVTLGNAKLSVERERGESFARITSGSFFKGLTLEQALLDLSPSLVPTGVRAKIGFESLDVIKLVPSVGESVHRLRLNKGTVTAVASFEGTRSVLVQLDLPHRGLEIRASADSPTLRNEDDLWVAFHNDEIVVTRLVMNFGGEYLAACGSVGLDGKIQVEVAGGAELSRVPALRSVLADASGRISVGPHGAGRPGADTDLPAHPFADSCLGAVDDEDTLKKLGRPSGSITVSNTLRDPVVHGFVSFDGVRVVPRGLGHEIAIRRGAIAIKQTEDKRTLELVIREDAPIEGTFDDGSFILFGNATLPEKPRTTAAGWIPSHGTLRFKGDDLFWSEASSYQLAFNADLAASFTNLGNSETSKYPPTLALRGKVDVTEGAFNTRFSQVAKIFGNALGRSVNAYSASLTERVPLLGRAELGLDVRGSNLRVKAEMDAADVTGNAACVLRVGGTLEGPQLTGRVEMTDGQLVLKIFARRNFEITRAWIDFDGDSEHPQLDLVAETEPPILRLVQRPGADADQAPEEVYYVVTASLKGRLPDIVPEFSSRPALVPDDIFSLIVTGKVKADFALSGRGSESTLSLFSTDIASYVKNALRSAFIESASFAPTTSGTGAVDVMTQLGKNIRLQVTGQQGLGYGSRFTIKISDRLSIEGTLRNTTEESRTVQRYETKLKYSIPLE